MLAARASAGKSLRLSRQFATVVEASGFKVAAVDNGQPTTAVTVLVKGGSRFETKPGLAHVLKNFAFKSAGKRSTLGIVREAELYGGVLSSSLTREHIAYTAEFLRGDEAFFVDVLSSLLTSPKFKPWEMTETVLPTVEAESIAAGGNPVTRALELAHTLAFRSGLGSSVFAPQHTDITAEDVQAYASSVFGKGNVAILGTGIDSATLAKLVEKSAASASSGAAPSAPESKYFGGETRFEAHSGPQTVFIGFGTTGASSAELAVLASHLSPAPSTKWGQGTSPISASVPAGTHVQTVLLPYSDATLFGLLVQGPTPAAVKEAATASVKALKDATGSLKAEDLKKAVAKAKFAAASAAEDRLGYITTFGPQLLAGSATTLDNVYSALDKVDAQAFSKATSTLLKSKPTFVTVGDVNALPYQDEIGL